MKVAAVLFFGTLALANINGCAKLRESCDNDVDCCEGLIPYVSASSCYKNVLSCQC